MTRSAAATVRWPGASIAPINRIWAFRQVGLRNSVAKGWSTGTIALGRVSIAWPFSRRVRPAYPVLIIHLTFVQSMVMSALRAVQRRLTDETEAGV